MFFSTSRTIHGHFKLARQTLTRILIRHKHDGRGKPPRRLGTLLPSRIQPEDIVDISGSKSTKFCLLPTLHATKALYYFTQSRQHIKFPQNTKGFLYFHSPGPTAPPSLSSLRFKICGSDTEARNGGGRDLMLPNGWEPWEKSMLWMSKSGFVDALVVHGIIPKAPALQHPIYDRLFTKGRKFNVYKPGQTFIFPLEHRKMTDYFSLYVVGDDEIVPLVMQGWKRLRAMLNMQEDLTLYLHLTLSASGHTADPIQICLSRDASSQLKRGMVLPYVRIKRHYGGLQPRGRGDALQSAVGILRKQMELENT